MVPKQPGVAAITAAMCSSALLRCLSGNCCPSAEQDDSSNGGREARFGCLLAGQCAASPARRGSRARMASTAAKDTMTEIIGKCICRYTSFSTIRNLAQTPLAHTITPVCVVLYYVGTLSPLATQPRHTRRASKLFYSSKLNNKDKKEAVVLYVMVIVNKPRAC